MALVDVACDDYRDERYGAEVLKQKEGEVPYIDEPRYFTLQLLLEQQLNSVLKDEFGEELDCYQTSVSLEFFGTF